MTGKRGRASLLLLEDGVTGYRLASGARRCQLAPSQSVVVTIAARSPSWRTCDLRQSHVGGVESAHPQLDISSERGIPLHGGGPKGWVDPRFLVGRTSRRGGDLTSARRT